MPVDPGLAGRVFDTTAPRDISRSQISAFADAVGDSDPVYHDVAAARAAGHPDVIAPPTYPIVAAFDATKAMLRDPDVAIDLRNVIHAEQRFEYVRPVHAGDVLTATLTVGCRTQHGGVRHPQYPHGTAHARGRARVHRVTRSSPTASPAAS
jgi:acyl dehydratase